MSVKTAIAVNDFYAPPDDVQIWFVIVSALYEPTGKVGSNTIYETLTNFRRLPDDRTPTSQDYQDILAISVDSVRAESFIKLRPVYVR